VLSCGRAQQQPRDVPVRRRPRRPQQQRGLRGKAGGRRRQALERGGDAVANECEEGLQLLLVAEGGAGGGVEGGAEQAQGFVCERPVGRGGVW